MSDFLLDLAQNRSARKVIQSLGLPIPMPPKLKRAAGPWTAEPLRGAAFIIGGAGNAFARTGETLEAAGADVDPGASTKVRGLVFDATGVKTPEGLSRVYDFFHDNLTRLEPCGRLLIIGPLPDKLGPAAAAAAMALDGFTRTVAKEIGREEHHHPTTVSVYFGEPGDTVPDPYHGGEGPERTGCILCGGCMLGCQHGAKNTLDKNYLYLAEKLGLQIEADTEVVDLLPLPEGGFEVVVKQGAKLFGRKEIRYRAPKVILSGGVVGTVNLLLRLKESSLPKLSDQVGGFVRTNSEVLLGVTTQRRDVDMSEGVAITSILHTDEHSHLEPVRYPHGAGAFRALMSPHSPGSNVFARLLAGGLYALRHPIRTLRAYFVWDWARYTMILLYMQTLDGHLKMKLGRNFFTGFLRRVTSELGGGPRPTAAIPEASKIAYQIAKEVDGYPGSLITETILGIPTTAHILGGCVMGTSAEDGVIDHQHRVFGYEGLSIIDGSSISANPGVNPSLSICALAERAMTFIPPKDET